MSIPLSHRANRPADILATPDGRDLWLTIASIDENAAELFKLQALGEFVVILTISDNPDEDSTPEIAWAEMQRLHAETDTDLIAIWWLHATCSHVALFKRSAGPMEDREYYGLVVGYDHRPDPAFGVEALEEIAREMALALSKRRDDENPRQRNARSN